MKLRKSYLHGRLENEVEDFIATLENEFDYEVIAVTIQIKESSYDGNEEKIMHVFGADNCILFIVGNGRNERNGGIIQSMDSSNCIVNLYEILFGY